jgi:inosine/xanthosine triphosphate pyrophosphatase family protein
MELWSIFIPEGSTTLAEMTIEERAILDRNNPSTLKQFADWYAKDKIKTK